MTTGRARAGFLDRLSQRQMTWLVILGGLLLYVPFAGSYGLWDPWETHYSEVARQMTTRADFISLWWPGSPRDPEVFWSKPVFTFWMLSLAMHVAGVGLPGAPSGEMALSHRAEWAVRVPMCLMGVLAVYAVYLLAARFVSRRAGVLCAVVLATCPMFSLIARQAMTDMPFVGPMSMALVLGAFALFDDEDVPLPRKTYRQTWPWASWPHHPLFYGTLAVFVVLMVPQLLAESIQLKIEVPWGGRSQMMFGAVAMIPYYVGSLLFVFLAARARSKGPLYLYLAAMLCGVAVLAKGLAGLGLPLIVFVSYLAFTWNWRRLRRAQLVPAIAVSLLACALVAAPWHHAMILRHGWAFWTELFGDNHWRRMVLGRHGDNHGLFDYFLHELGYGLLPWVALAPAALVAGVRRQGATESIQAASVRWFGAVWFVACYAVVSMSMTKFHHYVLPAIPGLALMIGCFLDDVWQRRSGHLPLLVALIGLPLLFAVARDLVTRPASAQLFLWLFSYDYIHSAQGRPWPAQLDFSLPLSLFVGLFAVATVALVWSRARRWAVGAWAVAAVVFTFFLLDVYMPGVAPYWSQKNAIASYYRARATPEEKLIAYQMYWRGETFYTQNEIYEGPESERTVFDADNADEHLGSYLKSHRGRRIFFMFERGQQGRLVGLLPAEARNTFTVIDDRNNKFSVARADL